MLINTHIKLNHQPTPCPPFQKITPVANRNHIRIHKIRTIIITQPPNHPKNTETRNEARSIFFKKKKNPSQHPTRPSQPLQI